MYYIVVRITVLLPTLTFFLSLFSCERGRLPGARAEQDADAAGGGVQHRAAAGEGALHQAARVRHRRRQHHLQGPGHHGARAGGGRRLHRGQRGEHAGLKICFEKRQRAQFSIFSCNTVY